MEVGQPQPPTPAPAHHHQRPPAAATAATSSGRSSKSDRPYRGIRMRKWGKWVAEIREPNKRSRIWLGSYSTPVAAARAYDTAVFFLRGRSARLNFPDDVDQYAAASSDGVAAGVYTTAFIRKKATEVGARVDALLQLQEDYDGRRLVPRMGLELDLNEPPSSSDEDGELDSI